MKTIEFDTHFYKKLWTLMVPIMVQNLMLALVAVADAFMLGGLDQNYMSAVSLATQIQFIQNMFLSAATAGLAILGAQYWGKQDIKALDDIFALAIRICGIVSVLFFVACAFFPRYLMLIFTNEPVLIDYGVSYLTIASFSYLLTGFSQCYIVMMKISGISSAAGIMIGNELGAGNLKRGKAYGIRMAKLSFLCGAVMTVLMAVSAPVILHYVKLTPQAAEYLKQLFGVLALYMIGRSVNEIIINGVFGSGGDTMFDMYSLAVTMWGIAIPLAVAGTYFLDWPVVVVYACTCVDEVGKIPWTLIHFKKYKWVKDLTR